LRADGQTDGPSDRQTDRYDDANSRFPQFCERAGSLLFAITQKVQAPDFRIFHQNTVLLNLITV